jgi:hypothetical protein
VKEQIIATQQGRSPSLDVDSKKDYAPLSCITCYLCHVVKFILEVLFLTESRNEKDRIASNQHGVIQNV